MYVYKQTATPAGRLTLIANESRLAAILWENDNPLRVRLGPLVEDETSEVLLETERQLRAYFARELKTFTIDLAFEGTPFQKLVWNALLKIPYGDTRTYSELADDIGNVNSLRAVGAANARNPIAIIVPCHRVIGTSGSLIGFAGGLENKARLLALEGATVGPIHSQSMLPFAY